MSQQYNATIIKAFLHKADENINKSTQFKSSLYCAQWDTRYELVQNTNFLQTVSATSLIVVSEQLEPRYNKTLTEESKVFQKEAFSPCEISWPCSVGKVGVSNKHHSINTNDAHFKALLTS